MLDAELGVVLFQPCQGNLAHNGEILTRRGVTDAAVILAKGDIERPVQFILHAPVTAGGVGARRPAAFRRSVARSRAPNPRLAAGGEGPRRVDSGFVGVPIPY